MPMWRRCSRMLCPASANLDPHHHVNRIPLPAFEPCPDVEATRLPTFRLAVVYHDTRVWFRAHHGLWRAVLIPLLLLLLYLVEYLFQPAKQFLFVESKDFRHFVVAYLSLVVGIVVGTCLHRPVSDGKFYCC